VKKFTIVLIVLIVASLTLSAIPVFSAEKTETETGAVSIVRGSEINLVSRESSVPVAVTNTFAGDVQVLVHLVSISPKVTVVEERVQLLIPAGTTTNAQFPVRAIGSGNVVMVSWLTYVNGEELGKRVTISLNVYPDIETAAIVLFLGGVAVLIVIGVIRTARRRQRS
jgi:hypothetical protein